MGHAYDVAEKARRLADMIARELVEFQLRSCGRSSRTTTGLPRIARRPCGCRAPEDSARAPITTRVTLSSGIS